MRIRLIPRLFASLALLSTGLCPPPASGGTGARMVQAGSVAAPTVLLEQSDATGGVETWVRGPAGIDVLQLPAGSWVNRVQPTGSGWVAGGTRMSAGRRELLLVVREANGQVRIHSVPEADDAAELNESTAGRRMPDRSGAVPIVEAGRLVGVAWLEGDAVDDLAVRAARVNERSWEAVETVAPGTVGGQAALSAAVLADGSWLLVWSRVEAGVSRTVWSRRDPLGQWTPARPLDGAVSGHEITPTVAPCGDGALVAWSRLEEGEYRLRAGRLVGDGWVESAIEAEAGALYPSLLEAPGDGCAWLLYQDGGPGGWALTSLDGSGRPMRTTRVPAGAQRRAGGRPVVSAAGDRAVFEWFGTDKAPRSLSDSASGSGTGSVKPNGSHPDKGSHSDDPVTLRLESDWRAIDADGVGAGGR